MENSNSKKGWYIVGAVVVLAIVAYAIWGGSSSTNPVSSGNPIKIGLIGPLTGDAAIYGQPMQNTIALAVDEINSTGGINGRPIQMIYEDGKCTGQDSVNAVQKLVNVDGVQVIIGGFCSGESIPAVPVAAQGKVLMLSPGSSSPLLTGVSPYFFRDYPSDAMQGKVDAGIANKENWRTVAFIQEQTDYAKTLYDNFTKNFQGFGGKTINQAFSSDTTDFRSILTTLKVQKPDVLFVDVQTPQAGDRILKQIQELGWKPHLMIADAFLGSQDTITSDASILEGAVGSEFIPDYSNSQFKHLSDAYKTKYGTGFNYANYMACVYDAVYLLRDGIKAVGYDGTALATWSRTIKNWPGASGNITIGQDGDRASGFVSEIIRSGQKAPLQ